MKLVVDKWFAGKGFGFGKVQSGEVVFIHASAVQGAEVLMVGWGRSAWEEEGKQSGRASEASSGADVRAGSSVGEESLRGVRPSSRLARRASRALSGA